MGVDPAACLEAHGVLDGFTGGRHLRFPLLKFGLGLAIAILEVTGAKHIPNLRVFDDNLVDLDLRLINSPVDFGVAFSGLDALPVLQFSFVELGDT